METGKFWFIIIFVCIVAGIFTGVEYFQGIDAANARVVETKSKLSQIKDTLTVRQEEWNKVSVLATKAQQALTKEAPLVARRDQLQTEIRRLEADFKYMVKSVKDSVEKIRAAGVGAEFPEVKLANGKVLKAAKIKKLDLQNISFIHADGFTIVPYDELPDDIRERFNLGGNGLAEQLEAAEQTLQTAKYSPVAPSTKPAMASRDQIGTSGVQTMQGLSINCPMPLTSVQTPTPPGIRQMMGWEAKDGTKGIEVNVMVSDALESAVLSLDGGVAGAVTNLEKAGIAKLTKSEMDVRISDLPAKRCSISGLAQGKPIYFEMLILNKEQRMYMVLVVFSSNDPGVRETANAILTSAKVE